MPTAPDTFPGLDTLPPPEAPELPEASAAVVRAQRFLVLSIPDSGQPYGALFGFAASDDLGELVVFATKGSRKHKVLARARRVACLIEDRARPAAELAGATAQGGVRELLSAADRAIWAERLEAAHPYLDGFARSNHCAMFRIRVFAWSGVR